MIQLKNKTVDDSKHQTTLELSFSEDTVKKAHDQIEKKLASEVEIKGFRKGKAPIEEARKHINSEVLFNQTLDKLGNEGYDFLLDLYFDDKGELKANESLSFFIERPKLDVKAYSDQEATIAYTFDNFPIVNIDLDKLVLKTKLEEVSEADVQNKIESALEKNKTLEPIEDKEHVLAKKEVANFDFEGSIDGELFDGGSAKAYELEIGSNQFIHGFEDQMVGMKVGETKDLHVQFPQDYQTKNLAGKDAVFKVTLNEIKQVVLPEYNDEFAKSLNIENVENDEQLRAYYKKQLEEQNYEKYKNQAYSEISELLLENASIDYVPESLVADEQKRMMQELQGMLNQYHINLEDYLKTTQKTKESLEASFHEEAIKRIKLDLIINFISREQKMQVKEEDINAELQKLESVYNPNHDPKITEKINEQRGLVIANLIQQNVYAFLFDKLSKKA